ncbi:hypothetical protein BRAS3809_5050006 [Bradyrhizobium sp. STM 3809]|nr:hypothetical protein BRAS3809_5050006 [Bradyrhizobium sp. STM 3809]
MLRDAPQAALLSMRGESFTRIALRLLKNLTKTMDLVLRSTPQACVSKDGRGR